MEIFIRYLTLVSTVASFVAAKDANVTLVPAATGFEGDNTAFVYGNSPLLVANDGSAADGGFRVFSVANMPPFKQKLHEKTGRSKYVVPVYDVGGRDVLINIPAPDSLTRVFDAESGKEVDSNNRIQLGDWSTACVWRSQKSGESYVFLFGKKMVVQSLVRVEDDDDDLEILEVIFGKLLYLLWRTDINLDSDFPNSH